MTRIVGIVVLVAVLIGACRCKWDQTNAAANCPWQAWLFCTAATINPSINLSEPVCDYADTLVNRIILAVPGTWNITSDTVCVGGREYDVEFLIGDAFDQASVCHQVEQQFHNVCPGTQVTVR